MDNKSNDEYIHLEFDKSQRSSDNTTSQAYTGKYDFLKLSNSKNSISRISKMLENSDLQNSLERKSSDLVVDRNQQSSSPNGRKQLFEQYRGNLSQQKQMSSATNPANLKLQHVGSSEESLSVSKLINNQISQQMSARQLQMSQRKSSNNDNSDFKLSDTVQHSNEDMQENMLEKKGFDQSQQRTMLNSFLTQRTHISNNNNASSSQQQMVKGAQRMQQYIQT